jgi:hypothetical protein
MGVGVGGMGVLEGGMGVGVFEGTIGDGITVGGGIYSLNISAISLAEKVIMIIFFISVCCTTPLEYICNFIG